MSDSSAALWTVTRQVRLPMGFLRQEYWSGLPLSSPGDLTNPEVEPTSPALAGGFFTTEPPGKACRCAQWWVKHLCCFFHFPRRCSWVKKRHLTPYGFVVSFEPVSVLTARRADTADTSLSFTLDQIGRIKDIYKNTKPLFENVEVYWKECIRMYRYVCINYCWA